ncbi:MAG TPA: 3-methyladenine DNA glycosylase [Candidatus Enterocloster faecavium]|uniref:DNA-(apurinic or apyrimidinic site) lyase n=1 Tax=Candidatus Enterocloster faecavium TaxID=2838560 RepID=A0A9D2L804_9FIRM|nr:3-methyladenine DNA glycosylase [Candidatus Enterocloster faecavium]
MTYTQQIPCFNLRQIADSGQCFRMIPAPDGSFFNISRGRLLLVRQNDQDITFQCEDNDLDFWLDYFDCSTDYVSICHSADPEDAYVSRAAACACGIRILRQDPWEMILTFVISQQKTIPAIRQLVETLCRRYGTPIANPWNVEAFSFPSPQELSRASLEELRNLKLGYRAKYIHQLCQDAVLGRLDLNALTAMSYSQAMDYLTGFYGIGKKVANCICLFGLHHIDAFPVDTWIQKILLREYYSEARYGAVPKSRLFDQILADHFSCYKGYAGVIQQYIFYYERLRSNRIGE